MATVTRVGKVDHTLFDEIVRRILETVSPEKIVLFGSHARARAGKASDVDILVIIKSAQPRYKRSVPIYRALAGLLVPLDIVVFTPEEVSAWSTVPQAFVTSALASGRVLYEKD